MFGVAPGGGSSSGALRGGSGRSEFERDPEVVAKCSAARKAACFVRRCRRCSNGCGFVFLAVCVVRASPNTGWKHLQRVSWRSTWCSNKSDRDGVCAVAAMPSSVSQ